MVERESPYKLAPGVRNNEDEATESSDSESEGTGAAPGTVFRLAQGQLKRLDAGMAEYEVMATRNAAKLGKLRESR